MELNELTKEKEGMDFSAFNTRQLVEFAEELTEEEMQQLEQRLELLERRWDEGRDMDELEDLGEVAELFKLRTLFV